jgi:Cysteine rich repeat
MGRGVMLRILMVGTVAAMLPTLSQAQDDVRQRGDRACKTDVNRLCKQVLAQGDMAILQCLQINKVKLSRPCSTFLKDIGQLQ